MFFLLPIWQCFEHGKTGKWMGRLLRGKRLRRVAHPEVASLVMREIPEVS